MKILRVLYVDMNNTTKRSMKFTKLTTEMDESMYFAPSCSDHIFTNKSYEHYLF